MPNGQDKAEIQRAYYHWLSETYGYIPAQWQRFEAGGRLMAVDESSPTYQYFIEYIYPVVVEQARREEQKAAQEAAFTTKLPSYIPPPLKKGSIYSIEPIENYEDASYTQRLANFLHQMVYQGAMSEEEAVRYEDKILAAIEQRQITLDQLPYLKEFERPDYEDWEKWYIGQVGLARKDKATRNYYKEQLTKLTPPEELGEAERRLEGLSIPEMQYELSKLAWAKTVEVQVAEEREQAKLLIPEEDSPIMEQVRRAERQQKDYLIALREAESRRIDTQLAQKKARENPPFEQRVAQKFQDLMENVAPATEEEFLAMAPSPATRRFAETTGESYRQATTYNRALADWNLVVARGLAEYEVAAGEAAAQYAEPVGLERTGALIRPAEERQPQQPAFKEFPDLSTWAGKYDWYKKFLATPPEWRPGGLTARRLAPAGRWGRSY